MLLLRSEDHIDSIDHLFSQCTSCNTEPANTSRKASLPWRELGFSRPLNSDLENLSGTHLGRRDPCARGETGLRW